LLCYGTRPQTIKAAVLAPLLRARVPRTILIDTGQHYDYELNELLYQQLGAGRPDHFLEVGSADHARQTAAVLERVMPLLEQYQPCGVVVIGDTNSTLGCALAAAKQRLKLVHVEAGLRGSDPFMAEEINRRIVDLLSTLLCAPSDSSARRLATEQLPGVIAVTGDVARTALSAHAAAAPRVETIPGWPVAPGEPYVFATLHRAELTDRPDVLAGVMRALGSLGIPVVFPAHPRTRHALQAIGMQSLSGAIHLRPPLGYLESVACTQSAALVVTDSGGVQREAYWLGTPCVTLRDRTEWQETVDCGANVALPPLEAPARLGAVAAERLASRRDWSRDAFGDSDAAERVARVIGEHVGREGG
jgi:UDP-N-acetylglucosamine 2-epimerase